MKVKFIKLVVSLLLVGSYFFLPKYDSHLLYPFSHANVFHLMANILCLWMLRCKMHLPETYLIAVLCSLLPSFSLYDGIAGGGFTSEEPTYGFSGILFAMVGISWGKIHRFRDMIQRNKWFLVIPAFIPHINFLIHIYCLLLGYLYGFLLSSSPFSTQRLNLGQIINKVCAKK